MPRPSLASAYQADLAPGPLHQPDPAVDQLPASPRYLASAWGLLEVLRSPDKDEFLPWQPCVERVPLPMLHVTTVCAEFLSSPRCGSLEVGGPFGLIRGSVPGLFLLDR